MTAAESLHRRGPGWINVTVRNSSKPWCDSVEFNVTVQNPSHGTQKHGRMWRKDTNQHTAWQLAKDGKRFLQANP